MKRTLDALLNRPLLAAAGFVAANTLVWFLGPLLTIGSMRPLATELARWIAISLWTAAAAAYVTARAARAARSNRQLMEGLVVSGVPPAKPRTLQRPSTLRLAPGAHDLAVIGKRFEEAIALLKRSRLGGKRPLLAALTGRPFVYQLPWYVIIGAPGAGKTTALVNSGLEFPLATRLGQKVVRGIGGTRNCDWWFTSEAVLIDTAGRFTTQDSDRAADQAAWSGFLDLLRRHRPRQPINGVLLAISVSDLLNSNEEERRVHAHKLRERVDELRARLGIGFPIYVLITKVDLLAGFMEFFADFDKEERAQVWGVTFPYAQPAPEQGPLTDPRVAPLARLGAELAALEKRLDECLIERLAGESDRERRGAIYAFPQQWRVLRATLLGFLQLAFAPAGTAGVAASAGPAAAVASAVDGFATGAGGAHRQSRVQPLLRGVYFTSATQEGTPMDRAIGGIGRALGLSARIVPPARPSGKTFFVTRLLRDLVFAEAGLAGTDLRWRRGRAVAQVGAMAATLGIVAVAIGLAGRAYWANADYVARTAAQMQALQAEADRARNAPRTDLLALVPALDGVRALAAAPRARTVTLLDFGLDQHAVLSAAARDAYQRALRSAFLPRIAARLEERLRSGSQDQVELIYEALKAYVMLFSGRNFDRAALHGYLVADWNVALPARTRADARQALYLHLDQLLASGEVGAPTQADRALISSTRAQVARVPLAQRAYKRLQQDLGAAASAFSVEAAVGASAAQLFARASGQPLAQGVPGLYSRALSQQAVRSHSADVLRQLAAEQSWVLGADGAASAQPASLLNEIERLYHADYVRRWDEYLRDLRIAPAGSLARNAEIAQALARPDSPLAALLARALREVSVPARAAGGAVPTGTAGVAEVIDARFVPLRDFVAGQRAPLAEAQALLGKLAVHLTAVDDAVKRKVTPPSSDVVRELTAFAPRAPQPVRAMLLQLTTTSAGLLFAAVREPLSRQLAGEVTAPCNHLLATRYPLDRASKEDIPRESFVAVFSAGGLVDSFFQRHIAPYIDTSTRPWTYYKPDGRPEPAEFLLAFQRAQGIRDALFRSGGKTLGAHLEFKLLELDPSAKELVLDVDGQTMRFTRDARRAQSIEWPGPASRSVVGSATGRASVRLISAQGAGREYTFDGPWALLRLFERVRVEPGATPDRVQALFDVEGRRARFEVRSSGPLNPIHLQTLEQFQCPQRL
jgi:type VI secretion system protein ImpL